MPFRYMSDFMREDCSQFSLVLHLHKCALCYEYIPARSGVSIDDICIEDCEPELDLRPVGKLGQTFPKLVYILIEFVILIKRVFAEYPCRKPPAKDHLGLYIVFLGERLIPL